VCYAGFSAVVFEAIAGGAAATKYNLLASLSNMPTAYLTAIEGWARTHHGVNAFLYVDLGGAIVGVLIYSMVAGVAARVGANTLPSPALKAGG
jgi:MFS transporter, PAT family, beta-lactamase induction signal transducer AmpG